MAVSIKGLDSWIRGRFPEINTELENIYFDQIVEGKSQDSETQARINALYEELVSEGERLVQAVIDDNHIPDEFDDIYELLGNVGFFMAACRRHGLAEPDAKNASPLLASSRLAALLGASINVAPRFTSAHLAANNRAFGGSYRSFSHLKDEYLFVDANTQGVFAYKRAAEALLNILPLGVSHPVTYDMLVVAKAALMDVIKHNDYMFEKMDVARFFYNVRPYYKPYYVGKKNYRGANAGDFAGISEIDMLLGLCSAKDPFFLEQLIDKNMFIVPADQERLHRCMRKRSILDRFLDEMEGAEQEPWFQKNAAMFLEVCEAHGQTAAYHHDKLVEKFIEVPAEKLPEQEMGDLTASGPPLPVLLRALEKIRDLRLAADRDDIATRYADFQRLKSALGQNG